MQRQPISPWHETFPEAIQDFFNPARHRLRDGILGIDVDVTEADGQYMLTAEIPGVNKEDITVDIDGNIVTIQASKEQHKETTDEGRVIRQERYWGQLQRTIRLPSPVDQSGAKATYQNGLLTLALPKKAGQDNKRIQIE